jgi:hypothetical protein
VTALLLDTMIDNFDEVEPILMKIDFEPSREYWEKWAVKEHFRLLQKLGKSVFERVPTMKALIDEKMKAQSLVFAMGIQKILSEIKEGEARKYVNLQISKVEGKIMVQKVKK